MDDEYVVGLDEFKEMNSEKPLLYTRDLTTCIAVLLHLDKSCILMHIAAFENDDIELQKFTMLVKNRYKEVINAEIFKAPRTQMKCLNQVCDILTKNGISFQIEDVFKNYSNLTSVGYNYNTKKYYMVDMYMGVPEFIEVPKGYKIIL